jgi:hypothetical protein
MMQRAWQTEHARQRGTVPARMLRVARFDRSVYAEVEGDPAGTRQAALVVALVAAAAALGTALLGTWHPGAILGAVLAALLRWLLWSGVDYLIGRVLFRVPVPAARLVRALGYAQTPQVLAALAFVPLAGAWLVVASRLLTLVAGNLAIGHALELRLWQALAIRLASFGIAFAAAAAVRAVLGDIPFLTAVLSP